MLATKTTLLVSVISCMVLLGGCASRTGNVNPIAEGEKEKQLSFATYAATRTNTPPMRRRTPLRSRQS